MKGIVSRLLTRACAAIVVAAVPAMVSPGRAAEAPSEGRLLVASQGQGVVQIFDIPSHRLAATVEVGADPRDIAVTPDGRKAYVSTRQGGVAVVDVRAGRRLRTIRSDTLKSPFGVGLPQDGGRLLVASEANRRLFMVDTARDVIVSAFTAQRAMHLVSVARGGRKAWATTPGDGSVTALRLPDLRPLRRIAVGKAPEGIAVTPNGRWVLVTLQGTDQVAILDAGGGEVLARLPVGRQPVRVVTNSDGFTAVVVNRGSNDITLVDVLARKVVATIGVGTDPRGAAINPKGTRAYVCNQGSDTVSVIALAGREEAERIPVASRPVAVAFASSPGAQRKPGSAPRSKSSATPATGRVGP